MVVAGKVLTYKLCKPQQAAFSTVGQAAVNVQISFRQETTSGQVHAVAAIWEWLASAFAVQPSKEK